MAVETVMSDTGRVGKTEGPGDHLAAGTRTLTYTRLEYPGPTILRSLVATRSPIRDEIATVTIQIRSGGGVKSNAPSRRSAPRICQTKQTSSNWKSRTSRLCLGRIPIVDVTRRDKSDVSKRSSKYCGTSWLSSYAETVSSS